MNDKFYVSGSHITEETSHNFVRHLNKLLDSFETDENSYRFRQWSAFFSRQESEDSEYSGHLLGQYGEITFSTVLFNHIPLVKKRQPIGPMKDRYLVGEYNGYTYNYTDTFDQELQMLIWGSYQYQMGYNSNLLRFYDAFVDPPETNYSNTTDSTSGIYPRHPRYGYLVLEQVVGTFMDLPQYINTHLYDQLMERYNLDGELIFLAVMLETLLALDQLQSTGHFLHGDLKLNNVLFRCTQNTDRLTFSRLTRIDSGIRRNVFYVPHFGLEPVIADFSLCAFRFGDNIFSVRPRLMDIFGLKRSLPSKSKDSQDSTKRYHDFGTNPFIYELPVGLDQRSQDHKDIPFYTAKDVDPDLYGKLNSYDLDTFILQLNYQWGNITPIFLKMIRDLHIYVNFTGMYKAQRWRHGACDGTHYMADKSICPPEHVQDSANEESSESSVSIQNMLRPSGLSHVRIWDFINHYPAFDIFRTKDPHPAFLDPQWKFVLKESVYQKHLRSILDWKNIKSS